MMSELAGVAKMRLVGLSWNSRHYHRRLPQKVAAAWSLPSRSDFQDRSYD